MKTRFSNAALEECDGMTGSKGLMTLQNPVGMGSMQRVASVRASVSMTTKRQSVRTFEPETIKTVPRFTESATLQNAAICALDGTHNRMAMFG